MTDLFDSLAERVGEVAAPAAPALDFLGLGPTDPYGQPRAGNLIEALGRGVRDAALNSPLGLAVGAASLAQPEVSARDRLIFGGLLLAGGAAAGRAAYSRLKRPILEARAIDLPPGFGPLQRMGAAPAQYNPPSEMAAFIRGQRPGARGRQQRLLGAEDLTEQALVLADRQLDDVRLATMSSRLEQYASSSADPLDAQFDWALFDRAHELKKLSSSSLKPVRELYEKFTKGEQLADDEWLELSTAVRQVSDALENFNADLSLQLTGTLESIEHSPIDGQYRPIVSFPLPRAGDVFGDENFRRQIMRSLNPTVYFNRGVDHIKSLYRRGLTEESDRAAGRAPLVPGFRLGRQWYQRHRQDILEQAGGDLDRARRLTAVAALSSAETNWDINLPIAKRLDELLDSDSRIADQDFQWWLRDEDAYTGKRRAKHSRMFGGILRKATTEWGVTNRKTGEKVGLTITAPDLKKILRLAIEDPDQVFASTATRSPKQKNFYLNLLDPDDPAPVTVDRHAFDVFWGLDTGLSNRPLDQARGAGDYTYDVIADAYRQAAFDLSREIGEEVLPHQVQSMTWEVWRSDKRAYNAGYARDERAGWSRRDPYRIKGEEGENLAYLALIGQGPDMPASLTGGFGETLPVASYESIIGTDGIAVVPDASGSVAYATSVDPRTDRWARQLYPAVLAESGSAVWLKSRPLNVKELRAVDDAVPMTPNAVVETVPSGTYLGTQDGTFIQYDWTTGNRRPSWAETPGKPTRVKRDRPRYAAKRAGLRDLTDGNAVADLLKNNAWAVLDVSFYDKAQVKVIRNQLRERGYEAVPLAGGEGDAAIVFGMAPGEAADLVPEGTAFTNVGEVTNRKVAAINPADLVTAARENGGFTWSPITGLAVTRGKPVGTGVGELRIPVDRFDEAALEDWVDSNTVALSRPAHAIGGWINESDEVVLEVSRIATTTDEARALAERHNQFSFFDLDAGEEFQNALHDPDVGVPPRRPWILTARNGDKVEVRPSDEAGSTMIERTSELADRHDYRVDEFRTHQIPALVRDLEHAGATNVVVYSRLPDIEGLERAREHVFRAPGGIKIVRTADDTIGEAHSVPIHVRDASALSRRPLRVEADRVAVDHIDFEERPGGKVRLDATEHDIPARDAATLIERFGHENVELRRDGKPVKLYKPRPAGPGAAARVSLAGPSFPMGVRHPSRDDVIVAGVRIVPDLETGAVLSVHTVSELQRGLEVFAAAHPEVLEIWRVPWIKVDRALHGKMKRGSYLAAVQPEPGDGIHLNADRWADELATLADLRHAHRLDELAFADPAGVVVHELGHVALNLVELLENGSLGKTKRQSPTIARLIERNKQPSEHPDVPAISWRAYVNHHEMVAEAFADVLVGGGRSTMAREVYDIVTGRLRELLRSESKPTWWQRPEDRVREGTQFGLFEEG